MARCRVPRASRSPAPGLRTASGHSSCGEVTVHADRRETPRFPGTVGRCSNERGPSSEPGRTPLPQGSPDPLSLSVATTVRCSQCFEVECSSTWAGCQHPHQVVGNNSFEGFHVDCAPQRPKLGFRLVAVQKQGEPHAGVQASPDSAAPDLGDKGW